MLILTRKNKAIIDSILHPRCHITMNSNTVVVWHYTRYWWLWQSWTCKSALQPYFV